jgi:hypothetical protein
MAVDRRDMAVAVVDTMAAGDLKEEEEAIMADIVIHMDMVNLDDRQFGIVDVIEDQ